jgi:hypothetical protein
MYCGRKNLLNSGASAKYSQTLKASQANLGANFISFKDWQLFPYLQSFN